MSVVEDKYVDVVGIKYNVKCKTCNHVWGVYLTDKLALPDGWNVCLRCASKKINVKGDVKNEHVRTIKNIY